MECPICIEEINEEFICEFCKYKICMECQITFMKEDLVCMNCKYPCDMFDINLVLSHKLKQEESFMLHSKKEVSLNKMKKALDEERYYFKGLECPFSEAYYTKKIKSLEIKLFSTCDSCGDMSFNDGFRITCECGIEKCSKCKMIASKIHNCNDEIISSENEISKNTKSCPGCGIPIFKNEGCYQVMCPDCKCVFDYNTGHIDTGMVHAPGINEMIKNLEKESKLTPIPWKDFYRNSTMVYLYEDVGKLLTTSINKINVNKSARHALIIGKYDLSKYKEETSKNYMLYYINLKKAKNLLKKANKIAYP